MNVMPNIEKNKHLNAVPPPDQEQVDKAAKYLSKGWVGRKISRYFSSEMRNMKTKTAKNILLSDMLHNNYGVGSIDASKLKIYKKALENLNSTEKMVQEVIHIVGDIIKSKEIAPIPVSDCAKREANHEVLELNGDSYIIYNPKAEPGEGKYTYATPAPPIENLVISGGGAKGVILPGVLKAFEEHEVKEGVSFRDQIKNVCGSSVGAITSGLIVAGVSAEKLNEAMSGVDFKALLGEGRRGPLFKSGEPLLQFIQDNVRSGIEDNLKKMFSVGDLRDITDEEIAQYLMKRGNPCDERRIEHFAHVISDFNEGASVTFSVLRDLHELNPEAFKLLTVTATCRERGETFYFNAENTPNLDISLACRASASLPIILTPVELDSRSLEGGKYSLESGFLTFVDGGYFDNVPVEAMQGEDTDKVFQGIDHQNLKTLALVFDESDTSRSTDGQSPFLNAKIGKHALYNPTSWNARLTRDVLARSIAKIRTSQRNTLTKAKGLINIQERYTQRNIPLKVSIKTGDFDKAGEVKEEYIRNGYAQGMEYLISHKDEALYRNFNTLEELLEYVPEEAKFSLLT